MSGYPSGPGAGENNEGLDTLFAQMREQQSRALNLEPSYSYYNTSASNNSNYFPSGSQPQQQQQPSHAYQQPFVSSALPTPPVPVPQPHHASAVMSPVQTPQPRIPAAPGAQSNAERTSSLLSLLKFSQPTSTSNNQSAPIGTPLPPSREASASFGGVQGQSQSAAHARGTSDLLATLMGNIQPKPAQQASPRFSPLAQAQPTFSATATSPPADTQAYLLQLLNKPKPPQVDAEPQLRKTSILTPPSKASTPDDIGELAQKMDDASLNMMGSAATEDMPSFGKENIANAPSKKLFTYVNPFEQLAASSPRNRTPKVPAGPSSAPAPAIQILKHPRHESPEEKRKADSSITSPAHTKRKLDGRAPASTSPNPQAERREFDDFDLAAIKSQKETVHHALHDVGDQADKQASEAIARAERELSQASIEKDLRDMLAAQTEKGFEQSAHVAAKSIKKELDKEENSAVLDKLPSDVAEEVKVIIDETAQTHVADSWESADAEDSLTKDEEEKAVKVYNFPMRPWTSIVIKGTEEPRPTFRDEVVMDIARLKKEFDQVDRTLVTASNNFIVYGMSKNGGIRVIRQDDGKDARLFTETQDRIFSVVTSVSASDLKESIIGTGVSGTVYWALIKDGEGDFIEDSNPELHGFSLPALQAQDIESPGGVLKTRARKSSNHPDFFGVGRGKYIHVVWPSVVMKQSHLKNGKDRTVDVEKYLGQQSLKINTGKAGKDFAFSEDDTVIVSLDKAGKVRFWDIRSLTQLDKPSPANIEIKEPLVTFITTPATEKAWPTSVLFVDKLRPYQRGGALRYMIVGMKQNHTLQLWDLALAKPVQEIHLPHSKESDAVCSVMYHAATGIIVVGHPTRNSVYFLHLSAPKYNLPKSISQAQYIEKLVANDPVAKPDSTAVISGMREYSLDNKGSLRSLDILQTSNAVPVGNEPITLFELYSMHSKGVSCINIKQADMGWTVDNKVINLVDASKAGVISIDTLKEIPAPPPSDAGEPASAISLPTRIAQRPAAKEQTPKDSPKKSQPAEPVVMKTEDKSEKTDPAANGASTPSTYTERKKRRKANSASAASATSDTPAAAAGPSGSQKPQTKPVVLDPLSHARNGTVSKANLNPIIETAPVSVPQDFSEAALKDVEIRISAEVKKILGESMESLYENIKIDKRTEKSVSDAKQDAMLRLVSQTLTENIQITLAQIVNDGITGSVIPAISNVASKAVNEQLGTKLNTQISQTLPKDLQKALPDAIGKALQQPQLLKLMSDALAKSVAFSVEEHFATLLQSVVTPAFTALAVSTSQNVAAHVQRKASEQIVAIERERHSDSLKIEQLTQLVTGLSATVSSMAGAQAEFQAQFLQMQQQAAVERRQAASRQVDQSTNRGSISRPDTSLNTPIRTAEDIQFDEMLASIEHAMQAGEYENAVIQWLQTRREQEFFERYFSKYTPNFTQELSPLLLLSLGATISMEFAGDYLHQKVAWLESILVAFLGHINAGHIVSLSPPLN